MMFIVKAMERSFVAIKPDGVQRKLVSEILSRFERRGYKLVALKMLQPTRELLEEHYQEISRSSSSKKKNFMHMGRSKKFAEEGHVLVQLKYKKI